MKRKVLFEIARRLKSNPRMMRKVKIFAAMGFVGVSIVGVLAIWAGVTAVSFVASKANEVIQAPQFSQIEKLGHEVTELSNFHAFNCWGKAESLMAFEPWLQNPALDNLKKLKTACFQTQPVATERSTI